MEPGDPCCSGPNSRSMIVCSVGLPRNLIILFSRHASPDVWVLICVEAEMRGSGRRVEPVPGWVSKWRPGLDTAMGSDEGIVPACGRPTVVARWVRRRPMPMDQLAVHVSHFEPL